MNPFQYRFALRQVETACQLAPKNGTYRTALGAAHYRAGLYKDALESLKQASQLNKGSPANQAFLAMTHHRLGDGEQARAELARLRETVQQHGRENDEEAYGLLRQAETLIGAERRDAKKCWNW